MKKTFRYEPKEKMLQLHNHSKNHDRSFCIDSAESRFEFAKRVSWPFILSPHVKQTLLI